MNKNFIYIIITTILFSSMEIALKFIAGDFHPVQMTFTRFLVGGIMLLPFAVSTLRKRRIHMKPKEFAPFALSGFIGVTVSMTLYQMALTQTQASIAAILFSGNPLFVMLFAYLLIKEPIHVRNIIALLFDVIGIVFIINPWNMRLSLTGVILSLASTVIFALYGVSGKKASSQYGGVVNTCFGFLFGSAEMILLAALTHISFVSDFLNSNGLSSFCNIPFLSGYSLGSLPIVLFVSIGVTGIGYACYFLAMEKTSANTVSLVFFFKPILAPALAFFLLKETITLNSILGILFILIGSLTNIVPGLLANRRAIPYQTDN